MKRQVTIANVFEAVDHAHARLHSAMRAAEMIEAIAHVCTESESDNTPCKEDLLGILRGLTSVCEGLTRDVAEADEALSDAWDVLRPVAIAQDSGPGGSH